MGLSSLIALVSSHKAPFPYGDLENYFSKIGQFEATPERYPLIVLQAEHASEQDYPIIPVCQSASADHEDDEIKRHSLDSNIAHP